VGCGRQPAPARRPAGRLIDQTVNNSINGMWNSFVTDILVRRSGKVGDDFKEFTPRAWAKVNEKVLAQGV